DGRADVAAAERVATPTQKCGSSKVNVRLTARIAAPPTSFPTSGCHTTLLPVDLDGDGADDLLRMSREGDLARSLSNRDGTFTSAPTDLAEPWLDVTDRRCAVGDLNGDDLGDLSCLYQRAGQAVRLGTVLSTPDGAPVVGS